MTRLWRALLIALIAASPAAAQTHDPGPFRGLTLAAALERLQQQGARIVFSSDLVRADMIVREEPRHRSTPELLDDLLLPYGLRSQPGPKGITLIVKAPPPASPLPAKKLPSPAGPILPQHFENVIVNGLIGPESNPPDSREHLSAGDLDAAVTFAGDPLLSVGRLAGAGVESGVGGLTIRGSAARETKIVVDGLELYEPYHLKDLGGPVSLLDSRAVGGVELLNGAFTAEHGGYMGGVVQMSTREPGHPTSEVAMATDGASVVTQGAVGSRISWLGSARQGNGVDLLNAIGADPGYRPSYWDLFAKVGVRVNDQTSLSFHVLGGDDEAEGTGVEDLITTSLQPGTFKSRHANRYAWITASRTLTPRLYSTVMVSSGHVTTDRTGSSPRIARVRDARTSDVRGVKNDWLYQSPGHLLKWGFDIKSARTRYDYGGFHRDVNGEDVGLYAADRLRVSSQLNLELGLRWDASTYIPGSGGVNPRVNAVYSIGRRTAVRVGWGQFTQSQKSYELQIEDGVTEFRPAEHADHSGVSVSHEFTNGLHAALNGYRKRMTALSVRYENLFSPISFFPEAEIDRVRVAPDSARADGLELTLQSRDNRAAAWWATYELARVEDRVDGAWVPRLWDQRHSLRAGFDWMPRAWIVAVSGAVHTGRPTTLFSVDGFGPRNGTRLDDYSRLDVRLGRSIRLHATQLDTALVVTDLFDRQSLIDRPLRQGLPRLITLRASWKF